MTPDRVAEGMRSPRTVTVLNSFIDYAKRSVSWGIGEFYLPTYLQILPHQATPYVAA